MARADALSAPIKRGQGNDPYRSEFQNRILSRGQVTPYDVNGAPTVPADPGMLSIYISNLKAATAGEPLYEFEVVGKAVVFTGVSDITAGVAATATRTFNIRKDGVSVGNITITGSTGSVTFSDSTFPVGALFSLYPPASADATLDRVRISLETA